MKNILALLTAIILSVTATAQPQKNMSCYNYQVNGKCFYHIENGVPGSAIEFYSEKWGGKMVKNDKLNTKGESDINQEDFSPAFILSKATNQVLFIDAPEFILENLDVEKKGNVTTLVWTASTDANKQFTFEVLKSKDGTKFDLLYTIDAASSKQSYTASDNGSGSVIYKIKVINKKQGLLYTSPALSVENSEIRVYPSLAKNVISIDVPETMNAHYSISNISGQVIKAGKLNGYRNEVDLSDMVTGSYLVTVNSSTKTVTQRIIKE